VVLTQTPLQFLWSTLWKGGRCLGRLFVRISKNVLIVLERQVRQDLAPLALDLTLNSSTCIIIKNEIFCNFYKNTKWILTLVKLDSYSTSKLTYLYANPHH